ncbi:MarR family transcriptional regulator [Pyxidicoccus parkwayensis]|uniref:MarR family transcriptional regulator n=1 Tax=Pyxidicoccus parkwayensis TaxID=2813578 RepID=A0ABX7P4Z5_9BACT|nr:MarR family transcriptional regulator [Pyxidicoccus parkwaysis]QSQ25518.1 MarR family transcriptional regulator [Pyxidicoccus parkwaysis]
MARPATSEQAKLEAQAWRMFFDFFMRTRPQRDKLLARLGLTPNDARGLGELDATEGRTMRSLADAWECDASNATFIVDRLESRGLVERRPHPEDRRIRSVVLTARGVRLKRQLLEGLYAPPEELSRLKPSELEVLTTLLARMLGGP